MIVTAGSGALEPHLRRWRVRRGAQHGLEGLAAGIAAGALVGYGAGLGPVLSVLMGAAFMLGLWLWRAAPLRRRDRMLDLLARHVDCSLPAAEDSCRLLLAAEAELTAVARLQRDRVSRALAGADPVPLPRRPLVRALAICLVVLLGAGLVGAVRRPSAAVPEAARRGDRPHPRAGTQRVAAPTAIAVRVDPPAYTRVAARVDSSLDLVAPEGARVTWMVTVGDEVTAYLAFASGDTVWLAGEGAARTGRRSANAADVYALVLSRPGAESYRSPFHRLDVARDRPPGLSVRAPAERRTNTMSPGRLPVRVVVQDDYGVADAALMATLARGTGENVRFREVRLEFDRPAAGRISATLAANLDLDSLGLEPGDELYFHAIATDTRVPEPNVARSDTYFLTVPDTTHESITSADAIAVGVLPEYFRSQRQIIIDTERLIGERPGLPPDVFAARSNGIGLDQKALRLRYGQFLGEEADEGIEGAPPGVEPRGAQPDEAERRDDVPPPAIEPFTHLHDTEGIATFFSNDVRERLKAVLAQMWEAELRLRLARPDSAVPFEYRALELLKALQEAARVYVLRVGFESPPLQPAERRLAGDLDEIGEPTRRRALDRSPTEPDVRAALALLPLLDSIAPGRAVPVLERAGRALARAALNAPLASVDALEALRTLIDGLGSEGPTCASCIQAVRRGLWRLLPPAPPTIGPPGVGSGSVAQRYFELLREAR